MQCVENFVLPMGCHQECEPGWWTCVHACAKVHLAWVGLGGPRGAAEVGSGRWSRQGGCSTTPTPSPSPPGSLPGSLPGQVGWSGGAVGWSGMVLGPRVRAGPGQGCHFGGLACLGPSPGWDQCRSLNPIGGAGSPHQGGAIPPTPNCWFALVVPGQGATCGGAGWAGWAGWGLPLCSQFLHHPVAKWGHPRGR